MNPLEIKLNFHKLIDNIKNENILIAFYEIMSNANNNKEGSIWLNLTPDEKNELISSEKESHIAENLISHSAIIEKHKKWL